jgi:hypothetical protein
MLTGEPRMNKICCAIHVRSFAWQQVQEVTTANEEQLLCDGFVAILWFVPLYRSACMAWMAQETRKPTRK